MIFSQTHGKPWGDGGTGGPGGRGDTPPNIFDGPCLKPLHNYCWLCVFSLCPPNLDEKSPLLCGKHWVCSQGKNLTNCLSPNARIASTYKYRGTRCYIGFYPANRQRASLVVERLRHLQDIVGSNPTWVACEVFFTNTRKAQSMQCYTHAIGG